MADDHRTACPANSDALTFLRSQTLSTTTIPFRAHRVGQRQGSGRGLSRATVKEAEIEEGLHELAMNVFGKKGYVIEGAKFDGFERAKQKE